MAHTSVARPAARRAFRLVLCGLALVLAAVIGSLAYPSVSSPAASFDDLLHGAHQGALGAEDGVVPEGASVFDDELPGVANLDPSLLEALRRAAEDASGGGVELQVNSGWRSPAYQEQLLREAVAEHGSETEAARWVATPETSRHVTGDAVDLGPSAAALWLSEHGARYGLCRVYDNEPWHFELRPGAADRGCPPTYADPTQDPRMQG
jgi:zinc D-Ala-D-Ala carboxypeptidase